MAAQSFLLTRPAAASARFASLLRADFGPDIRVVISPMMEPVFLTPALPPGTFDAMILTSETGAEAARRISAERRDLPVRAYCVGDRTAQAAADAGFRPVSAEGDADALLTLIRSGPPGVRLLHLRGADTRGNLAERLISGGVETQQVVVYEQRPCPLMPEARVLLDAPDPVILPLFSPRSAVLMTAIAPIRAALRIAALSPAVAACAAPLHPEKLVIADHPDARAMLQALHRLQVAGWQT